MLKNIFILKHKLMPSDSIIRDLELIIIDKKKELEEVEKAKRRS